MIQLAGTRRVLESAHKLIGATWGDEGTTRIQHAWTADPSLIRTLADRPGLLHPPRRRHLRPGRPAQTIPAAAARRPGTLGHHPPARPATRPRAGQPAGTGEPG